MSKNYISIIQHYKNCLNKFGDSCLGMDWPNEKDATLRHKIMLDLIREKNKKNTLLDFGCGTSQCYEYIQKNKVDYVYYSGLDISPEHIKIAELKFPLIKYYCIDVLSGNITLPTFDYIIMNGVFTEKILMTFQEMFNYFSALIRIMFNFVEIGIAFNVMSKQVDWEREDLFHLSFDDLANFLKKDISKNFIFRNDYGLYEYTTYVYK